MSVDVLLLDSGEWVLAEELAAQPWHVLIYHQRGAPGNELHIWLPEKSKVRSSKYAFKRFWNHDGLRWCVEAPRPVAKTSLAQRIRFTTEDGQVRWAYHANQTRGIGDMSDRELTTLLERSIDGPYVMS